MSMAAAVVKLKAVRVVEPLRTGDPHQIGSYRLLGRLGSGGMGQVFLGASPGGLKVAVKVMHTAYATDQGFRRRFAREVAAARRVGGFHTALVVEADPDADPPWMVTAYIKGPSLAAAVHENGPLDIGGMRDLGAALAEGLAAIHACGLIHRDLKPSNVVMADDGPRIIDFGIARSTGDTPITSEGTIIGSYLYMSPEQLGSGEITAQSDVFSLGGVLTFAATGHSPFGASDRAATVSRILTQPPDLAPLSGPLRAVISSCLAKDPAARPGLADLLAYFVTGDSSGAQSSGAVPETAPSAPTRWARSGSPPTGQPMASPGPTRQTPSAPSTVSLTRSADLAPASPLLDAHTGKVTRVTFSPDGRLLATASADLTVHLWDTETWKPTGPPLSPDFYGLGFRSSPASSVPPRRDTLQMRFSPDGRVLLTFLQAFVLVWDTVTHQQIGRPLPVDGGRLHASPDGCLLAEASGGTLLLWNTATRQHAALALEKQTSRAVQLQACMAFSGDGRLLAANDSDGDIHLWDTATGQPTGRLRRPRGIFSAEGLRPRPYTVSGISLSPDGRLAAVLGQIGGYHGRCSVDLWDISTQLRPSRQLIETNAFRFSSPFAFSPDSRLLAGKIGKSANSIRLWDTTTRKYTDLDGYNQPAKVMFSPNGRLLAEAGQYCTLLWNTTNYQPAAVGPRMKNFKNMIGDAAFSPDSRLLATAEGKIVRVWELP